MNRDKTSFLNYVTLSYALLGTVSILLLVANRLLSGDLASFTLSLGTELLGATIIFLFVDKILLRRNYDLIKLLENVVDRIDRKSHFLKSIEDNPEFEDLIVDASRICLLGNSFVRFLRTYEAALAHRLDADAALEILILDPTGEACQLLTRRSGRNVKKAIETSLEVINSLVDRTRHSGKGTVDVRTIDWCASCGMHLIDPEASDGYIRVTLYAPDVSSPLANRPHFILSRKLDPRWYRLFWEQYETLWAQAKRLI